jgi:predicted metal-dependent HD superfamily phosphohydrolase
MPTADQWQATWSGLGIALSPRLSQRFEELISRYSEAHRKYHTCRHLDECFEKLGELRSAARHPYEVELGLWFHDAIYEKRSAQNEAKSAELASTVMTEAGAAPESVPRVHDLIMATRHAAVPVGADQIVLVDVDLSILGAPAARFDEYERQVREEYSWVPSVLFRRERRKVLEEFLARPSIFTSELFRQRYEARARDNLQRSVGRLGG